MSNINPLLLCDFYKIDHRRQYPKGTSLVYSNFTPRKSRIPGVEHIIFFGLQGFIKQYLIDAFNNNFFKLSKKQAVDSYKEFVESGLGPNAITYDHIAALHDLQYLPIAIKALPEGAKVPMRVPVLTMYNTHPDFYWLPNFLETVLSAQLWQPITSATIANEYRKILDRFAEETSTQPSFVDWQGHDFSFRGMSSVESAMTSGAGHLLSFTGTDTIPAMWWLNKNYNAPTSSLIGGSVAATEHSVMCAGEKDSEFETFKRLITEVYPTGIVSIVSDTWDLWKVLTDYLPRLKDVIEKRKGKVVIRPDSGDPVDIICGLGSIYNDLFDAYENGGVFQDTDGQLYTVETQYGPYEMETQVKGKRISENERKGVIELLYDVFGGTKNDKGYIELPSYIGAIYGDSITIERATQILQRLKNKGFASTNVVFGIGSFTYQYNTRDTFGFAMKATYVEVVEPEHSECYIQKKCLEEEAIVAERGKDFEGIDICSDGCVQAIGGRAVGRAIFKDPITDDGTKKSAKGLLAVFHDGKDYFLQDDTPPEVEDSGELELIFQDSTLLKETTLEEIRTRLKN